MGEVNEGPIGGPNLSHETAILLRRKKCYGPNNDKNHCCLINTPESAHTIVLVIIRQTYKYPYDGYPIYQLTMHKDSLLDIKVTLIISN